MKDMMKGIEIVYIEPTNACNTSCVFCPREKMKREIGFMDDALFKKIADECAKENIKEINLAGYGESFLDLKIAEKIRYIKSKYNPIITLSTNCSLLNPEINRQIILSGLDELKVSIYSLNPEEYKREQKFELNDILNNLIDLKSQKEELNSKTPYIIVCFLKEWHNKEEYKNEIEKYVDKVEQDKTLNNYIYGRKYNKVNKNKLSCEYPSTTVIIRWNGDLVPCCFDFDSVMVLGNVKNSTIKETVNSEKYLDFCDKLDKRRYNELPYCNVCDQPEKYTLLNVVKRFYYLKIKRRIQNQIRQNFYKKLQNENS